MLRSGRGLSKGDTREHSAAIEGDEDLYRAEKSSGGGRECKKRTMDIAEQCEKEMAEALGEEELIQAVVMSLTGQSDVYIADVTNHL